MNKTAITVVSVIGVAVIGFYGYGAYKRNIFKNNCLANGGRLLSENQCEFMPKKPNKN